MKIKWYMGDVHACGMLRAEYPTREIIKQNTNIAIDVKLNWNVSDMDRCDLMMFQRAHQREAFHFMRSAQERGILCLYDTDDDMLQVPDGVGDISKYHRSEQTRENYKLFFQYADAITTTTVELARAIKPYTQKGIYVVENATHPEHWEIPFALRMVERRKKPVLTVGWTNSPVHLHEAPMVGRIAQRTLDAHPNVEFAFLGSVLPIELGEWTKDEKYKTRLVFIPWVNDVSRVPELMRGIDIGICPLSDMPFNKSRSNIKWQQYGLLAQPAVVQAGAVYANVRHGETGLVANTEDEWCAALTSLITSVDSREDIGAKARLDVLANWDLRKRAGQWVAIWKRMLEERKR